VSGDLAVVVSEAGMGERLLVPFGEVVVRLAGVDTGGALSVVEMRLAPRTVGAEPHVHAAHEEYFAVREGELTFDLGGSSRTVGVDGLVSVPRGHAHGFRNEATAWTMFIGMFTPAGYEDYFRDVARLVGEGVEVTPGVLAGLRAGYGTSPA